jgi:hypothetical protein
MAHLTKYTRAQLPHLLKHDSRAKDAHGNYIKFGNQEIDTNRTYLNYNLHERNDGLSDYEYIKLRGQQYLAKNVINRDNINWAGSWVLTLPEKLKGASLDEQRKFFQVAHDFMAERYGYDNIVGAYVHNDESTPHMHVKITPVIWDKKKEKFRHSAKDMFDKKDLAFFHQHLSERMVQEFGYDVGVIGDSVDRAKGERLPNKSIAELKADNKKLNQLKDKALNEVDKLIKQNERLLANNTKLKEKNLMLRNEMESTSLVDGAKKVLAKKTVDRAMELAEGLTKARTHELEMERSRALTENYNTMQRLSKASQANAKLKKSNIELQQKIDDLEAKLAQGTAPLHEEINRLREENKGLHKVIRTLQRAFDRVETFIKGLDQEKSWWGKFKRFFRSSNPAQYEDFQDIRHDKDLHAYEKENSFDLGR